MGDMADFTLDQLWDDEDAIARLNDDGIYEDEDGPFMPPFAKLYRRTPSGPGPCPCCGSGTLAKTGRNGPFYGCIRFPACKGSRNGK